MHRHLESLSITEYQVHQFNLWISRKLARGVKNQYSQPCNFKDIQYDTPHLKNPKEQGVFCLKRIVSVTLSDPQCKDSNGTLESVV